MGLSVMGVVVCVSVVDVGVTIEGSEGREGSNDDDGDEGVSDWEREVRRA